MTLLIVSFVAGVLTVLAPCILPLLPVIVGGSIAGSDGKRTQMSMKRPLVITGSLVVSLVVFSILLKSTVSSFNVSDTVLQVIAGSIIVIFGVNFALPKLWEKLAIATGFYERSTRFFSRSTARKGRFSDVVLGASLGPVFSSCSPTYFLIVGAILPVSFAEGLLYLTVYSIGLAGTLLLIAFGGQKIAGRLGWLTDPNHAFIKVLGVLFIIVGIGIMFGIDKDIQEYILDRGLYDPIGEFEQRLGL